MTDEMFTSAISRAVEKKFPEGVPKNTSNLVPVWAEVVEIMIGRSQDEFLEQEPVLHIDLKPEMAVSLVQTVWGIAEKVVEARTAGRNIAELTLRQERDFFASAEGKAVISETAKVLHASWLKRYQERWKPKTTKKLDRESNPSTPKRRNVNSVGTNHYISRFFLKKYWAENGTLTRHMQVEGDNWKSRKISFGEWGHQEGLYSNKLEDRFSLIEGDAEEPIRKILNTYPLNDPERQAFLGYHVVQKLRNPFYRKQLIEGVLPVSTEVVESEKANDPIFQRDAYETIFENNDLYDQISHPLFWSKWVMVRATEPVFVLPDTANLISKVNERSVLFAPLTPSACFVTSGIPEKEKGVVPYTVANDDLAGLISKCLIASSNSELISHSTFSMPVASELQGELLDIACARIDEALLANDLSL
jgi:hypothetical protein